MQKYLTLLVIVLSISSEALWAQDQVNDTSLLYHPEEHFWYPNSMPFVLFNRAVSKQRNIVWATAYHTATMVPLGCIGPEKYTSQLKGIKHNTNTSKVIKQAISEGTNVILVIGDGMGGAHMSLPILMNLAKSNGEQTMFEQIMNEGDCGYQITSPANGLVTGSAAAGTALATGTKTLMGMVGVDSNGMALESIIDVAKAHRMKTALVSDAPITDATPAAFYGHVVYRYMQDQLAYQLVSGQKVDVAFGGGASDFIPQSTTYADYTEFNGSQISGSSSRKDGKNLIADIQKNGFTFVCTKQQMLQLKKDDQAIGLFASGGLPAPIDQNYTQNPLIPNVSEMADLALNLVGGSKHGYFAMIEIARIDWEAHANDAGAVLHAVKEMDKVLKIAYEKYKNNPKHTLLVFTADHETGGLSIAYEKVGKDQIEKKVFNGDQVWENDTDPLRFSEYQKLESQNRSLAAIFSEAKNPDDLKEKIEKYTGYILTDYQALEIMNAIRGKNVRNKNK